MTNDVPDSLIEDLVKSGSLYADTREASKIIETLYKEGPLRPPTLRSKIDLDDDDYYMVMRILRLDGTIKKTHDDSEKADKYALSDEGRNFAERIIECKKRLNI